MLRRNPQRPQATGPQPAGGGNAVSRRNFLCVSAATTATLGLLASTPALAASRERAVSFYSPHTGETLRLVYWTPSDGYIRESMQEINYALRDHYNGLVKRIDKHLIDLLYTLRLKLDSKRPLEILCGYRSPQTNAMLRQRSSGVAKNSFHMYGQATDIHVPGRGLAEVRRAAMSLKLGGVGYYPRSGFVHVDTGPVRYWG